MTKQFQVTVVRTIATVLTVEADSAAAARKQVDDYGIGEAWADYPHTEEDNQFRIKAVAKASA